MRILHLFSNYKWTGPAEPAASLAAGLLAGGVEVVYRSSAFTKRNAVNHVAEKARELGLEPVLDLALAKHRSPWRDLRDRRALARILARERFDLIHCHLANDHRIAAGAAPAGAPPLVRTVYETEPERLSRADLRLLQRSAQGIFVFSSSVREHLLAGGIDASRVQRIDACIDLERFRPDRDGSAMRRRLGFDEGDFLAGIVARVQPQRRFELLLDAVELAAASCPRLRVLVIGRGSKLERVAREPARVRGLLDRHVFFPGYFTGEDYPDLLSALDVKLFLVPGTDGTARAVREALASGKPVICTPRGMLPELVRDGASGYVLEERPRAFADALIELCEDAERRLEMGRTARADAETRFRLETQVALVRRCYESLLVV